MILELIHSQRPAVIIEPEAAGVCVVRVLNAQILNFVARLRDRIAEASQNHRRNRQYPEIPQIANLSLHTACSYPVLLSQIVMPM